MNFIIGATGYIGSRLYNELTAENELVTACSSRNKKGFLKCDLAVPDDFNFDVIKSGSIIYLAAALSSPDVCANEYDRAWAVNVTGTKAFIDQCISRGARIIFFSSDTVYGEKDRVFDETETCSPAGEYAQMKHAVETAYLGSPLFKSIRLSYVFSKDDKFTRYLLDCASKEEDASIFHPFYRAVIHRDDVVRGVIVLAKNWEKESQQIINFGGATVISRIEYAEALRDTVIPTLEFEIEEPGEEFFRNRPRVIRMQSKKLSELLGREQLTLQEAAKIEFQKGN